MSSSTVVRLAGLLCLLILGGCGEAQVDHDKVQAWDTAKSAGLADARAAIFLSTPLGGGDPNGYLGLIDSRGSTRFVRTGALDAGRISARGRTLCAANTHETFRLTDSSATRQERKGVQASGQWAGLRPDGSCVMVFNSGVVGGTYHTDVYWVEGGKQKHSVVPDVPGPTGLTDDALWVSNAGSSSTNDGVVKLFRVDLHSGAVSIALRWRAGEDDGAGQPSARFAAGSASDLFEFNGALYFLETVQSADVGGPRVEFAPGKHVQLRLVELKPQRSTVRSTYLTNLTSLLFDTDSGDVSPLGAAFSTGFQADNVVYTADAAGHLFAVDLASKTLRVAGMLSSAAAHASDAAAGQVGEKLGLFLFQANGDAIWETYDAPSASLINRQQVSGLSKIVGSRQMFPYSFALLD